MRVHGYILKNSDRPWGYQIASMVSAKALSSITVCHEKIRTFKIKLLLHFHNLSGLAM